MFTIGQAVKCIDEVMEGIGPALDKGRVYHVENHLSPEEARAQLPGNLPGWEREGGRVGVKELPKCHFFGRRFQAVE